MDRNKIYHMNFLANTLPDGCASLIIADPPYFEVKGDFDFVWPNFEAYLADVERWAQECKRVLAPNGTLIWWGHALKIAYSQVILDRYFNLLNSGVWEKIECQTMKSAPSSLRSFAPVTERALVYENFNQSENDWKSNNAAVYWSGWDPIRNGLQEMVQKAGGPQAVADRIGASTRAVGHWISKSQWSFPSLQNWAILQEMAGDGSERLRTEFERLRTEFERLRTEFAENHRRPFNLPHLITDVWRYSQESHITGKYNHDTCKPPRLTSMLINVTTKRGDLVVVPFAGSGTECEMAIDNGRDFIGFDIDPEHVKTATERCAPHINQLKLF